MQKSYFNNSITGNSSMLATFSEKSELLRLYWPNIDYQQQLDKLLCGIYIKNEHRSTVWLNDNKCQHSQEYIYDTNIIKSNIINQIDGYSVEVLDYVHHEADVLVRQFEIKNLTEEARELGFMCFSAAASADPDVASTLFDFKNEALIHYKMGNYLAISSDNPVGGFQIGNSANDAALSNYLFGKDDIGMMKDAAVSWDLGSFKKK